ncbi:MAG: DNA cytosine methyltransferase [Litoreibacter sp.]
MIEKIDLFAGCGGLSLGFVEAGFKSSHFVEIDKWSCETLRRNFRGGVVLEEDVAAVSRARLEQEAKVSDGHIIVGGPPCQGFSHSNVRNKDPKDPRNSLFKEYVRIVEETKPQACVIENVPGLLTTKTQSGAPVIDIITSELDQLGYRPDFAVLDAADFGVPQFRRRVFIVGIRKDQAGEFVWPTPSENRPITCWEAMSDLPQVISGASVPSDKYSSPPHNDYQKSLRTTENAPITHHEPMRHTKRIVERFAAIKHGESEADVTGDHAPRSRGNAQVVSKKVYAQNSRRQHSNRPCNTVVSSSHSNFIHPYLNRNFTVRELLRLQSFPDDFSLAGKRAVLSKKLSIRKGLIDDIYNDQRVQVGNAVPPKLAFAIASSLKDCLSMGQHKTERSAEHACT